MYIMLLAWRYLRTRFIAVASIVSVTLGVATLIVVNAVMAGFVDEMHDRLHGILSDIEIAGPGLSEINQVDWHVDQIKQLAGDDLESITTVVRVPALLHFEFRGRPMTHTIMLIGIDDETFGTVTDFHPYLANVHNQKQLSFELRSDGYDPEIGHCGWPYRREIAEFDRQYREQLKKLKESRRQTQEATVKQLAMSDSVGQKAGERRIPSLPSSPPVIPAEGIDERKNQFDVSQAQPPAFDPYDAMRPPIADEDLFDPARDQYTGIIIGKAIASRPIPATDTQEAHNLILLRPGDDVHITLPTAGANPTAIMENCTIVDFYSSNMHEYDSSFAFMPLSELQSIRGMIDPYRGDRSVSAIQIKFKPGVDLSQMRDKLIAAFPPDMPYMIQTWQDTQRPLLNAVNLELTILNILLFLIIGVAGFGILATFFMIVVEKTKDIGILKSLGAPGRGVMSIFLAYGLSLGSVGTGVGILLGLAFVWKINEIANLIQFLTGREIFDPMIYYFNEIPTIVSPWMVVWVAAGAIMIAVLASVLPAIRAARLHPVDALRYE